MNDMVQEMYEDNRENIILQENLISKNEEKQEILENMHEMETRLHIANEALEKMHETETQLHDAKEALSKYVHEK